MSTSHGLRATFLTVTLAVCGTLSACGSSDKAPASSKPTAAELKAACDAVFDKVISCGGVAAAVAPSYKASTCTDANSQSFADCASAAALLAQAKSCQALDCTMSANCALALVPNLMACVPDAGT